MSDVKQVKVDNWGIYFLQRLKHFFNRTDYCDLTLQFQDNAQLKVHRLVLNVCTEYFELLERTCEMYEDCLVMPDDLQADVVVPIVNFMYTGQLEFKKDSLDRLYQTSQVMNMPVLTKLLEAHRGSQTKPSLSSYSGTKKLVKSVDAVKATKYIPPVPSSSGKRPYSKAFESNKTFSKSKLVESHSSAVSNHNPSEIKTKITSPIHTLPKEKKYSTSISSSNGRSRRPPSPIPLDPELYSKKCTMGEARPTRYELPEELDTDNVFENSFTSISYESKPLMVHPEATKQYTSKKNNLYNDASTSKKRASSTVDIVECKKIPRDDGMFHHNAPNQYAGLDLVPADEMFQSAYLVRDESSRDPSQLFDQILDSNESPKVTIEGKDKHSGNLDHAKIISEVLKKYPHLVKGNKNIKLKILNTNKVKKTRPPTPPAEENYEPIKTKSEYTNTSDICFTDVLDSKEATKLIAMGAENVKGPWICLICGTPGKALNFTSYYNFRRHLVEVHNEKPVSTICEYCGLRSYKRNYLLHHIYTKHGVPPPPQYHFPKCNMCDYVALTEGFLVKHKLTHSDTKPIRCYVCSCAFSSLAQLALHVQKTGHRMKPNRKENLQCVYCLKVFLRENNFYVHLKTNHKEAAIRDGRLIEDSDDERPIEEKSKVIHDIIKSNLKYEQTAFENEYDDTDIQYHVSKKARTSTPLVKHKILNPGFSSPAKTSPKPKITPNVDKEFVQEIDSPSLQTNEENVVIIDGNEYIMKYNQLIPKKIMGKNNEEFIISDLIDTKPENKSLEKVTPSTSLEFTETETTMEPHKMLLKKSTSNQPIQIVVSNEEEYKALMSSNHSIIFDDGDANKTLTVLTAPNTSMDNPCIDLDSTQTNDMMIIQEGYPLSVTETLSTDSKYVVVYSHAVGHDESSNKQYQIITPQEIAAEYVQSAVITNNYENVTTSTIPLNTHVVSTDIEESWPEQSTDVQMAVEVQPNLKQVENTATITNLPEVLISGKTVEVANDIVTLQQIRTDVVDTLSDTVGDNESNLIIAQENTNHTHIMNVDISSEIISNKESEVVEQTDNSAIMEEVVETTNEVSLPHVEITAQQEVSEHKVMENEEEVTTEQQSIGPEENNYALNPDQNTTELTAESNIEMLCSVAETVPVINDDTTIKKSCDQIKTITSEWSEDEYDAIVDKSGGEKFATDTAVLNTDEPEVEESIENIQQEMQNQLSSMKVTQPETEQMVNITEENNENIQEIVQDDPAQEKISSLLNDWDDSQEDSASQEDIASPNENREEAQQVESQSEENQEENSKTSEIKKDENIKSLVSDWDDDDEEEARDQIQ